MTFYLDSEALDFGFGFQNLVRPDTHNFKVTCANLALMFLEMLCMQCLGVTFDLGLALGLSNV